MRPETRLIPKYENKRILSFDLSSPFVYSFDWLVSSFNRFEAISKYSERNRQIILERKPYGLSVSARKYMQMLGCKSCEISGVGDSNRFPIVSMV